ncbi:LptF/LptG family permease [uncultured Muribaculum sp.]|uniref:LptF/LptG family permease n=3 Tax=uncultured Muribaculum sp. TaxID=1918613 RepID=UPI0026382836|nr:LptF/LptG family permease [uncultured Muribaculum sp.]
MLRIKRLYLFMLQSFLPLFLMTFFICLFIVLMQFLWRYIDDLVGKGLDVSVIAELFFYAALTMVPMALPLAILLASLMTFGNLGEQFELTAMKASGVSLIKSMRPLIVLMVLVAIGAFFFQNNVLPVAQTKMWTLLYSMRQKSPELDIPEKEFYDQITGFNIYVNDKDRETGILRQLLIYNVDKGADNATIIYADSGKMSITDDKEHLFLTLWNGEQFENLREQGLSSNNVPYRRESFTDKEVMITFDANFTRMDESGMRNQYVGKNIRELQFTIDSVGARVDSIGNEYGTALRTTPYFGVNTQTYVNTDSGVRVIPTPALALEKPLNIDSLFNKANPALEKSLINQALAKAKRSQQEYEFKSMTMKDERKLIRRHAIELMKKYTLSMACLVFFFIGAPLGAIIRKGGLGMPLVISVFLFIFYYIIDNTGYKLARDGRWAVWEGIWLSTFVLLPLGIFFTYKAVNDSAVFNRDAYVNFFRKLIGRAETRNLQLKEMVIDEVEKPYAKKLIDELIAGCQHFLNNNPKNQNYISYWLRGYNRVELHNVSALLEKTVDYVSNSRSRIIVLKLMELPIMRNLLLYHPTNYKIVAYAFIVLFPLGLPVYFIGRHQQQKLRDELLHIITTSKELLALLDINDKDIEEGVSF